ncbi:hypothetical protein [Paenibacillus pinihumi]|uniref:hypothetical protein n=1 Tax=Paenibacillus pinihumi TaxID=669462 RepID=UPI0006863F7B|nr:hypothetical protein [Paenibacillus pinihumi]
MSNGMSFDTKGFTAGVALMQQRAVSAAKDGMHDSMDDLLRRSRELAPLDKGILRMTAWSEVTEKDGVVEGAVYYSAVEKDGNGRFNYALRTHEMGEYKNPTTPGTQPKYLERPYKENVERYRDEIAAAIRKELT